MGKENLVEIIGDNALIRAKVPPNLSVFEMRETLRIVGLENEPPVILIDGPLGSIKDGVAFMDIPKGLHRGEDPSYRLILGVGLIRK